jgi:hypothetical protein
MTDIILPAQSYEEALPYLRRPYMPNQIRALILNAPDNPKAPCSIALYAIGETPMDRFNLACAGNWSRTFETIVETERIVNGKTFYYCQVKAVVFVFGVPQDDLGEGEAETRGGALMNARAQGWKRAGRWHGPGQCLYAAEQILMWRSDKDDELFVPKSGDDPHRRPFLKEGGQKNIRRKYEEWLKADGESVFGEPLDHLAIYKEITHRASTGSGAQVERALPPAPVQEQRTIAAGAQPIEAARTAAATRPLATVKESGPAAPPPPAAATQVSVAAREDVKRLPMPDVPAGEAAVEFAESAGFNAHVAHALSNLARIDGQTGALTDRQNKTIVNWLAVLSEVKTNSEEIVKAVEHLAGNGTTQENRQATFSRWLAAKTAGDQAAATRPASSPPESAPTTPAVGATEPEAAEPAEDGEIAVDAAAEEALEVGRGFARIHRAMDTHGYSDRTVTQLAALAVAVGPKGQVDWQKVPAQTVGVLADLLESAGAVEWNADTLAKEVMAAHNSSHQTTPAGRFSAFAGRLADLAEARAAAEAA